MLLQQLHPPPEIVPTAPLKMTAMMTPALRVAAIVHTTGHAFLLGSQIFCSIYVVRRSVCLIAELLYSDMFDLQIFAALDS